jgi:hypothetical protein
MGHRSARFNSDNSVRGGAVPEIVSLDRELGLPMIV